MTDWSAWLAARTREDGDCLLWTRAATSTGCPVATIELRYTNIRQWVMAKRKVLVPEGYKVVPECRNVLCLSHLVVMSPREMNLWIAAGGGHRTPARLAASRRARDRSTVVGSMAAARQVRVLRSQGLTYKQIEVETGVPWRRCYDICSGKTWVEHAPGSSVFHP